MAILTHGSDLSLAPTLGPVIQRASGSPRKAFQTIAEAGFASLQLDATVAGLRPRELDASARRDLGATLRRSGLSAAGIDFFIPTDHYTNPAQVDRAVASAHAALQLAADLGRVPLSVNLPIAEVDAGITEGLFAAADGLGVRLAVHHESDPAQLRDWLSSKDEGIVGAAIDPAALLGARHDPISALQAMSTRLAVARLSDGQRGQADGSRSAVGQGDLDLVAYRVSVDLAPHRLGPVVLDLRMLAEPVAAANTAQSAWQNAAMQM